MTDGARQSAAHPPRPQQDTLALIDQVQPASLSRGRFGTFAGVFTPSILTILGVVMYLRFGWVVGNAGVAGALAIVAISHLITIATGLSVSTIATNRTVGAGGAYYMISRSLGAPTGAAIGLPLFFGQALSVSFYVVGFTESLQPLWPDLPFKSVAVGVCLLLALISLKSADLALKVQYLVMAAIALSLLSFFTGRAETPPAEIAWTAREGARPFAEVFAVFFPAVTGIMAGVGMSGDLKDPRRALPVGTMAALFTGFAIYTLFPLWLGFNADTETLRTDNNVVWSISRVPSLIFVGVWGATLSSAIGSLLTAPRTLQALANDGLVPRFLGRGHGPHDEPRIGIGFTLLLAAGGVMLGNLDVIANILTMFFLATYGLTNLACGLERWAASPSFRPEFRVPWWVSIAGAVASFYVMSIIDLLAMVAALVICGLIFVFVQRRALGTTYGDARHGIWAALVRTALLNLQNVEFHPQNWRPNVVIMGGGVDVRPHLLELGSTIVQDRGVVTFFHLLKGRVEDQAPLREPVLRDARESISAAYPNVFCRVEVVDDIYRGAVTVAQSYGLGSFEANTVMMGWPKRVDRYADYLAMLRELIALDRSLLLVNHRPERGFGAYRNVQIWWGGLQGNGGLMLLLAYLIVAHPRWNRASVTLMIVVQSEGDRERAEATIKAVLDSTRLQATPRIIMSEGRNVQDIMRAESAGADLAIIGTRLPAPHEPVAPYFEHMSRILANLPTTILVRSAHSFPSEPVLFQS